MRRPGRAGDSRKPVKSFIQHRGQPHFVPMFKSIKPYLGTAMVVIVTLVVLNLVKPYLPASVTKYL